MVKKTRKNMPIISNHLKRAEISFRSCNNLVVLKWHNKRHVWMITTSQSADFVDTTKIDYRTGLPIQKLTCVIDYNASMGAVDKIDMV